MATGRIKRKDIKQMWSR